MTIGEIERGIRLLLAPDAVAELRVPNASGGTRSGYFDDWSELAKNAALLSGTATGVFATLNPVRDELLARSANRITDRARYTTTDADIIGRRWMLIDLDPARPAGISSSELEHVAALERAQECRRWLIDQGWPEPVLADSGNGAHLLCRVDLPNDAQARDLIRACLEALALQFDDAVVCVDQATYNASRICKVYGTLAAKGDNSPHRPHRLARLLTVPGEIRVVDDPLLLRLALQLPRFSMNVGRADGRFDLASWIEEHNLPIVARGEWKGGRKWLLNPCPWNPEHRNRSAFIVQLPNGAIAAGCHHESCHGNDWRALRGLFETGQPDAHEEDARQNPGVEDPATAYRSADSALFWIKQTPEGPRPIQLSNFSAHVITDVELDDGGEVRRSLEIEAL